ncbi:MAG: segregation/condensation protein A [Candidatus Bilamarchaeaceae archaeon]
MDLPLTSIVGKPSWKQVLVELVITEKLDPWDIDIVKVSDAFFGMVKQMEKVDFHIPANIILASAILLKYKSNALRAWTEPPAMEAEGEPIEAAGGEIPLLLLKPRIPPRGPITLGELILEMEKAMKYDEIERPRKPAQRAPEIIELAAPDYDIEAEMCSLYSRMKGEADEEGLVLFSRLVKGKSAQETILTLAPLLHLAQEKAVGLRQDKWWGEIFIKVNGWSPGAL